MAKTALKTAPVKHVERAHIALNKRTVEAPVSVKRGRPAKTVEPEPVARKRVAKIVEPEPVKTRKRAAPVEVTPVKTSRKSAPVPSVEPYRDGSKAALLVEVLSSKGAQKTGITVDALVETIDTSATTVRTMLSSVAKRYKVENIGARGAAAYRITN